MLAIETACSEFTTGHGSAGLTKKQLGHARRLYKGVYIRCELTNPITSTLYVGPSTLSAASGYSLLPGGEVFVQIDNLSKVHVLGADSAAANAVQTVTMGAPKPGDRYRLTFDGETTDTMVVGESPEMVQAALEALTSIGAGNVDVSGISLLDGGLTIEFIGDLAGMPIALLSGEGGTCEEQEVAIDATTSGGTFTLSAGAQTTGAIAFDAAAADVRTALEAVLGAGNVEVSGGPGPATPWLIAFIGDFVGQPMDSLTGDGTSLTGGSSTDVTVTEIKPGVADVITVQETQAGGASVEYSWLAQ